MEPGQTGLMAPADSPERKWYEEELARKEGLWGLAGAMAGPLKYSPFPQVSIPATVVGNMAEKGPAQGLMSSWDSLLPYAMKAGPGVMTAKKAAGSVARAAASNMPPERAPILPKEPSLSPEVEDFIRSRFENPVHQTMIATAFVHLPKAVKGLPPEQQAPFAKELGQYMFQNTPRGVRGPQKPAWFNADLTPEEAMAWVNHYTKPNQGSLF